MRSHSLVLLATFCLFLNLPGFSQSKTERANVDWGPAMDSGEDGAFHRVWHNTDDFVYVTMGRKKETFLTKLDRQCHVVYQKLLPFELNKVDHDLVDILFIDDRILVYTSAYDKKAKTTSLYLRVFNESDMTPIATIEKLHTLQAEDKRNTGDYAVLVSPNDERILVRVNLPYEKEGRERFGLRMYDKQLQMLWERQVELPYNDNEFTRASVRVDDDGSVLLLGVKYDEKREAKENKKKGDATYVYHLLVLRPEGGEMEDHTIDVRDKFLQDMTFAMGKDGDVICGGFWGNKSSWSVRGAFFLRLDRKTKTINHESFKEFDHDFITAYMTEKEERKAEKKAEKKGEDLEMYNFDLDDIILRDDGGAVMVGEQAYQYTRCYTDSKGYTRCSTYYVHNDIVVINIDAHGDIEWASKIPKRQTTVNDGGYYSSYAMTVKGDNIFFVFNDSGKNLFLAKGDKVEGFELKGDEALITLATVDGSGMVHREALLSPEKRDAILRPKSCWQVTDDRMFIFATRKKEFRFGFINFL
ncbi:MAG TPA: hypothetical protein VKG92_11565 [Flavobacteriales bacterium]|nr:hypothetical protein [Flavobacteriales bacterium]